MHFSWPGEQLEQGLTQLDNQRVGGYSSQSITVFRSVCTLQILRLATFMYFSPIDLEEILDLEADCLDCDLLWEALVSYAYR